MKLTIDFETRSCINLKDCGAWVYSEDPTTDIMCLAVKEDDKPGRIWVNPKLEARLPSDHELPLITLDEIASLAQKAEQIESHNLEFERSLWQNCFSKKYGIPMLPLDKLRCSLAKASYHSLPRGLGELCKVLGVEVQKDDVGAAIMRKMCRPKKLVRAEWKPFEDQYSIPWKDLKEMQAALYDTIAYGWHHVEDWEWRNVIDATAIIHWHEDPDDILALCRYCLQDVEAEHAASKALADLPARELRVWQMDQEINARGLNTDTELAHKMVAMVEQHTADLLDDLATITNGEVQSPRQTAKFKAHVNKSLPDDLQLADVKASSVLAALKDLRVQGEARRLLEIRRSLALSSVAKYEAILNRASMDGRVRGSILYHGAGTGRFSGRGIQPHNFPRGKFKDPEPAIEMVLMDDVEGVKAYWGDPMAVASTCLRGVLTPGEGKEFTCADYSNIEGRGVAWLAGEEWKVESFRAYDKGEGEDNYKLAYSRAFNIPVESVTSDNRQIGKVMELACLAGGTKVLTLRGWVPLAEVTCCDAVWDGVEWVLHDGVIHRGKKECMYMAGVNLTPDHQVLMDASGSFAPAQYVLGGHVPWHTAFATGRALAPSGMRGDRAAGDAPETGRVDVYDLANCGPRNRYMILTTCGPLIVHNCGYQGGVGAFQSMAAVYGVKVPDDQAAELVKLWRQAHPMVVALWYSLEEAALMAVAHPGKAYSYRSIAYKLSQDGRFLLCRLPSGRLLHYPFPALEEAEMPWGETKRVVTYMATDSQTGKFVKSKGYGGLFTENCFTADTKVVTDSGIKPISEVLPSDRVWDGLEWVCHDGVAAQGRKEVIEWQGTRVTPEHRILVGNMWISVIDLDDRAEQEALKLGRCLAPSQLSRFLAEGTTERQYADVPAVENTRQKPELSSGEKPEPARIVPTESAGTPCNCSPICSQIGTLRKCGCGGTPAFYQGATLQAAPRTQTTAGEGLRCTSRGEWIEENSSFTQKPCRDGMNTASILTGLTTTETTNPETSELLTEKSTPETDEKPRSSSTKENDCPSWSSGKRIAQNGEATTPSSTTCKKGGAETKLPKYTGLEEVYDLVNCGPRNRFMILADAGPVIVHNCVQALSRDVMVEGMFRVEEHGYPVVLTVHDEVLSEHPVGHGSVEEFGRLLSVVPSWADGLPVAAAGWRGTRYRKG